MTRKLFFTLALASSLFASAAYSANENARAAQQRLKDEGFYRGEITGQYDSDTAAALTRYQIRHGLGITGKLDAATAKALGVTAPAPNEKGNAPDATTWRQLRQDDAQFLERLNAGEIPAPSVTPVPPRPRPNATSIPTQTTKNAQIEPHGPPPPPPEAPPAAPPIPRPVAQTKSPGAPFGRERIRDYLAAFILAGLDPRVGAELEFFGDRVDYFGERNVPRQKIRADLLRYDRRWPERHFTLAGELEIQPLTTNRVRVTFPLRYELRSPSEHAAGLVRKTLTLQRTPADDWEIVAVDEEKAARRR